MEQLITLEVMPDGNLKVSLTPDGREELPRIREFHDTFGTWCDLMEIHAEDGSYSMVHPEKISALTDSPIIGYMVNYDEESNIEDYPETKYWWFPDYQVVDEFEALLRDGYIIFTKAD